MTLTAIALNCSLKRSDGEDSSTDQMIGLLVSELKKRGVEFRETIRIADHDVKPGVTSDEGEGDAWPELRSRILDADILIFGTPIWLGQMSSLAKRVVERMDAFLSETDEQGRMPSFSRVAADRDRRQRGRRPQRHRAARPGARRHRLDPAGVARPSTGSARRWGASTSRICRTSPTRSPRRRRWRRATRRISRGCSRRGPIRG